MLDDSRLSMSSAAAQRHLLEILMARAGDASRPGSGIADGTPTRRCWCHHRWKERPKPTILRDASPWGVSVRELKLNYMIGVAAELPLPRVSCSLRALAPNTSGCTHSCTGSPAV